MKNETKPKKILNNSVITLFVYCVVVIRVEVNPLRVIGVDCDAINIDKISKLLAKLKCEMAKAVN